MSEVVTEAAPSRGDALFVGPVHIDFDLTSGCNLACSHCSVASDKPLPDELGAAQLIEAIDAMHALGVLSLTVAGGEPFLHRDAVDLLAHACALPGWTVTVITNGTYLGPSTVQALAARCPGLTINVSVDGSTTESFATLRHRRLRSERADRALFDRVIAGIERAVSADLKVHANFTLTRVNKHDLRDTYELVTGLGARDMLAIKFFTSGRGLDHADSMEFAYDEWAKLLVELTHAKAAGEYPKLAMAFAAAWEFYLPLHEAGIPLEEAEALWKYRSPLREALYAESGAVGDPSGIGDLNVLSNGDVYPITLMSGVKAARCGNFTYQALGEIWTGSPTLRRLRRVRPGDLPQTCQTCEILHVCGGGSRARALIQTGRFDGPDMTCPRLALVSSDA